MSVAEIEKLLHDYRAWLRDKTTLREINGNGLRSLRLILIGTTMRCKSTPVRKTADTFSPTTASPFATLKRPVASLIRRSEMHATAETFPLKKHSLIQAMLAVNDLFYLARPVVESLFYEDVVTWLEANEIRYTPNVKFTEAERNLGSAG